MKLAIVGSRTFNDYDILKKNITAIFEVNKISEIISGGAIGADTLAEIFADEYHIKKTIIKPEWNKYGRGAGLMRNTEIVKQADFVFAFYKKSKGTKDTIEKALKSNTPLFIVLL